MASSLVTKLWVRSPSLRPRRPGSQGRPRPPPITGSVSPRRRGAGETLEPIGWQRPRKPSSEPPPPDLPASSGGERLSLRSGPQSRPAILLAEICASQSEVLCPKESPPFRWSQASFRFVAARCTGAIVGPGFKSHLCRLLDP